jgi:hypothetical protein
LNKKRLQGLAKKIKDMWYGTFELLKKVGDNTYIIGLLPYMHMYSVVNVENLKFYDPSMLNREEEQVIPTIDDLASNAQEELIE